MGKYCAEFDLAHLEKLEEWWERARGVTHMITGHPPLSPFTPAREVQPVTETVLLKPYGPA